MQQISLFLSKLMREQAVPTDRVMASVCMVRHHLWQSQAWLPKLHVVPSAMFGREANKTLQLAEMPISVLGRWQGCFNKAVNSDSQQHHNLGHPSWLQWLQVTLGFVWMPTK